MASQLRQRTPEKSFLLATAGGAVRALRAPRQLGLDQEADIAAQRGGGCSHLHRAAGGASRNRCLDGVIRYRGECSRCTVEADARSARQRVSQNHDFRSRQACGGHRFYEWAQTGRQAEDRAAVTIVPANRCRAVKVPIGVLHERRDRSTAGGATLLTAEPVKRCQRLAGGDFENSATGEIRALVTVGVAVAIRSVEIAITAQDQRRGGILAIRTAALQAKIMQRGERTGGSYFENGATT